MDLIYISNTRLPSEKANAYQSMVMCESFSYQFANVRFWHPISNTTTEEMKKVKDPFVHYQVEKRFELEKIKCYDSNILKNISLVLWFWVKSISFALFCLFKLRNESEKVIVFSRDMVGLRFLSFAKRKSLIKQRIFFEAHVFSKKISFQAQYIDGLIVINKCLKELYEREGLQDVCVAHDGVKTETFKVIEEIEAKKKLDFQEDAIYLTYVGRFNTMGHEKGIPEIIKSFSYLDNDKVRLLFVGGPLDNISEYKKVAEELNVDKERLVFIDRQPVSELYKYICASKVLLMPFPNIEHYAYFMSPLKMFEYMASKRVIVATRLPSIEEVLEDKHNAVLCAPDDPQDLAQKIEWVLDQDCSEILEQAYIDVQEYTWKSRAEKIYKWIRSNM